MDDFRREKVVMAASFVAMMVLIFALFRVLGWIAAGVL